MEPPSYEDACVLPRLSDPRATGISPPPSNGTSISSSLPPPPTYQEAGRTRSIPFGMFPAHCCHVHVGSRSYFEVSTQPDPFPLLILPSVQTSPPPNSDTIVHPLTQGTDSLSPSPPAKMVTSTKTSNFCVQSASPSRSGPPRRRGRPSW